MPAYDTTRFSPPAPLATVELRDGRSGKNVGGVPMLLDTGADITLLPNAWVEQLQISSPPSEVYELIGFDGSRTNAVAIELDLVFLGLTFRGRFAIIAQPEGIIGRNILN